MPVDGLMLLSKIGRLAQNKRYISPVADAAPRIRHHISQEQQAVTATLHGKGYTTGSADDTSAHHGTVVVS